MKSKNLKLFYLLLLIISSVVLSSCLREGRYDGARFNGVLMSELNNRVTEYYIHQTDNSVRTISSMQSKYELTLNLFSYLATQSNDQYGYGNVYQLDVNKVENDVLIDFSHGRWFPENITNFEGFTISGSNASHYFLKHNYDFKYKIKIVNLETHESYFIKEIVIPAKEFYGDDSYIIINENLPKRTFITYTLP